MSQDGGLDPEAVVPGRPASSQDLSRHAVASRSGL